MKKFRQLTALFLAFLLMFSLAACGNDSANRADQLHITHTSFFNSIIHACSKQYIVFRSSHLSVQEATGRPVVVR